VRAEDNQAGRSLGVLNKLVAGRVPCNLRAQRFDANLLRCGGPERASLGRGGHTTNR